VQSLPTTPTGDRFSSLNERSEYGSRYPVRQAVGDTSEQTQLKDIGAYASNANVPPTAARDPSATANQADLRIGTYSSGCISIGGAGAWQSWAQQYGSREGLSSIEEGSSSRETLHVRLEDMGFPTMPPPTSCDLSNITVVPAQMTAPVSPPPTVPLKASSPMDVWTPPELVSLR